METDSAVQSFALALALIAVVVVGGFISYNQGYLDPVVEKIAVALFKAKAMAEKKRLQAQGMKAGEDFLDSSLKGNEQASQVMAGVGSLGGLKKQL